MHARISVDPNIHFGKPCIAGTRIPVQSVLELVRDSITFSAIVQEYYPDLSIEDVQACVQYAIDVVGMENIQLATSA